MHRYLVSLLFTGIFLFGCAKGNMELYGLQYGTSDFASKYIFYDGDESTVPFAWFFWALRDSSSGDVYLLDCGIEDPKFIQKWNIEEYQSSKDLLKKIDINVDDVTGVILSHLHADHVDGCSLFPRATFYLQRREYEALLSAFEGVQNMQSVSQGYYRKHLEFITHLMEEGRLILLDGDVELTPEISVELAPFHTKGTQSVYVWVGNNKFILVPDNAYVYENVEQVRALGTTVDRKGNERYLEKLARLHALSNKFVIPGHDPALMKLFPLQEDKIARIR